MTADPLGHAFPCRGPNLLYCFRRSQAKRWQQALFAASSPRQRQPPHLSLCLGAVTCLPTRWRMRACPPTRVFWRAHCATSASGAACSQQVGFGVRAGQPYYRMAHLNWHVQGVVGDTKCSGTAGSPGGVPQRPIHMLPVHSAQAWAPLYWTTSPSWRPPPSWPTTWSAGVGPTWIT